MGVSLISYVVAFFALVRGANAADPSQRLPWIRSYNFSAFMPLNQLPGAQIINPPRNMSTSNVRLVFDAAQISGPYNVPEQERLITYTTPVYYDASTRVAYPFARTLRMRRGGSYSVAITNNLVQAVKVDNPNTIENPGYTNLHTHGLFDSPGVYKQELGPVLLLPGDNIFYSIAPRKTSTDAPITATYTGSIPLDHMPGLHWAHPHKHGSSSLQVSSAHFAIVVEDDNKVWLPDPSCQQVVSLLEAAEDTILDIQLYPFYDESGDPTKLLDFPSIKVLSNVSNPQNPLCCTGANGYQFSGAATIGDGKSFLLLNGGWQPVITMASRQWQRWRLLYSGMQGAIALQIIDPTTNAAAPQCQMMLIAKDGVYMMQIPRRIPAVLLPSGGRAELLVRCGGARNTRYVITTRNEGNPFLDLESQGPTFIQQDVLATIVLSGPSVATDPVLTGNLAIRACTPRRPAYATDLRNPALAAAGYPLGDLVRTNLGFNENNMPSGCNVNFDGTDQYFKFPDSNPITMPLGKVIEWRFFDPTFHPLHVHVNPFQIQVLPQSALDTAGGGYNYTTYFEAGDFHDTLLLPMLEPTYSLPLRFQPEHHSGFAVMHCHFLAHEDTGCMKVQLLQCPGYPLNDQPRDGVCNTPAPVRGTVVLR